MAMNSLVNYESTDEEDNDSAGQASVARDVQVEQFTNGFHDSSLAKSAASSSHDHAALLGPARPLVGEQTEPHQELDTNETTYSDNDVLPDLPERDLLRYLTQPSHPTSLLALESSRVVNPTATTRFRRFLDLKKKDVHFNDDLAGKSSFKNPSLFSSLLARANLSAEAQYATTLSTDTPQADIFPAWAYREELAKSQQILDEQYRSDRRTQSAAGKRRIEFIPGSRDDDRG